MSRNPALDKSFRSAGLWRQEADRLREILVGTKLTEELKWGKACYTHDGSNICIIQRMKGFLALLFFKGALLKDPDGVLEVQGPNSRSGYRMRFTSVQQVANRKKYVEALVREAIDIEKSGLQVEKPADIAFPDELLERFAKDPDYRSAFDKLTSGRQRGYALHFSGAKQSKTREARIEKCRARILRGKGMHDR